MNDDWIVKVHLIIRSSFPAAFISPKLLNKTCREKGSQMMAYVYCNNLLI